VIPDLIEQYVDTGKVRYVYREFPLTQLHPAAQPASEAAVCAGQQGAYWEMNEKLFETVDEWGAGGDPTGYFKSYAEELGLDTKAFNQCLDSGEASVIVQGDVVAAQALGVNATPYFFVNEIPLRGGLPVEALGEIIDYAAAGGKTPQIVPAGDDWRVIGDKQTARAIAVAFASFDNADSADHALTVMPQLREQYIDSGKLIYILHPVAGDMDGAGAKAAIAAECAGEQGQYWEMYKVLFEEQAAWSGSGDPQSLFVDYAEVLELDTNTFQECLDSEWAALRVQAGSVLASLYGVPPGGPVFLFNNGQGAEGSPTFEEFQTIIESILSK
jgi:protein-disulfide isomerase